MIARPKTSKVVKTGYKSIALSTSEDPYDYAGWLRVETDNTYGIPVITCGNTFGSCGNCSIGHPGCKISGANFLNLTTDGFVFNGTGDLNIGPSGILSNETTPATETIYWRPYNGGSNIEGWSLYLDGSVYGFAPSLVRNDQTLSTTERWAGLMLSGPSTDYGTAEHLEDASDRCEDVANAIEAIVLKNA